MLHIQNVKKKYITGDLIQTALDGVSLTLRDNEFVAILGPSGSGKTTLLNVIGGLDRYDSGDLIINGISTKKYSDRDWDSYRNHTIGFVFQSYNLIPHQTVLSNVELALTISGISRGERRKRATKALEDVGLGEQLHKRPNQMSGGQMQRVAIARALVNNPDILLADEPTGALDSETSVQVMELLKEVSKDRLVVMVTHNPELAEEYANRIVRVRDGKIIDDTNPLETELSEEQPPKHKNMGRASMSFFTALSLSFNNLRTKIGRTLLTAFAGSIGIIGIALILSLSTGFQRYIDKIQEDTLSSYPLTIQSETADMTSAFMALGSAMSKAEDGQEGVVVEQQMMATMFAQVKSNDLGSFKKHLDNHSDDISEKINVIKYGYGVKPLIYAEQENHEFVQVNPGVLMQNVTGSSALSMYMDSDVFKEMIDNTELLDAQYDVLRGRWPEAADELIIVLSDPYQISDYVAYTLGLKDTDDLQAMIQQMMRNEVSSQTQVQPMSWTYEELMALEFHLVPAADVYRYNQEYAVWEDMRTDKDYMSRLYEEAMRLKVVGIVCPKEDSDATMLSTGVAYTQQLTKYVIEAAQEKEIVHSQLDNPEVDVFTGKRFDEETEESGINLEDMIKIDEEKIASAFGMNVDSSSIMSLVRSYMQQAMGSIQIDTTQAEMDFAQMLSTLGKQMMTEHILSESADGNSVVLSADDAEEIVAGYLSSETAQSIMSNLETTYSLATGTVQQVCNPVLTAMIIDYVSSNVLPDVSETPEEPTEPEETIPQEPEGTVPEEIIPSEPTDAEETPVPDEVVRTLDIEGDETMESPPETDHEQPEETTPAEPDEPAIDTGFGQLNAVISLDQVDGVVDSYMQQPLAIGVCSAMGKRMMLPTMQAALTQELAGFISVLMNYIGNSISVDEQMLASAFQFNMNEEELQRLMEVMSGSQTERSLDANLKSFGFADFEKPISIAVYFTDFASKEYFLDFLDQYNLDMETAGKEEQVIQYTDVTSIMMSSVRTIIDSVSYVLIAFVAVSLVVSSIMIGIITYISVMERTKEIGILRAIGASKRNISQVFNAETFIIGFCSGLIGVGVTLIAIIPINYIIHSLTDNPSINAYLPTTAAIILVLLSMLLTLIGGLIPAKHAAKKDPVIALRTE